MLRVMKKTLMAALLLAAPFTAHAASATLNAAQWALPQSGSALVREPALAAVMQEFIATPKARLVLHYPGGDEGSLWVHQVRAWLVALGVSSARIELVPGAAPGHIEVNVDGGPQGAPVIERSVQ